MNSLYINITGGGTFIFPKLLENGGASQFFIGGNIPYHLSELRKIVPDDIKPVSEDCSRILAFDALDKAFSAKNGNILAIGIGATSSLIKHDEREDRVNESYITIFTLINQTEKYYSLHLLYPKLTRLEQEDLCANSIYTILNSIRDNGKMGEIDFSLFDVRPQLTHL